VSSAPARDQCVINEQHCYTNSGKHMGRHIILTTNLCYEIVHDNNDGDDDHTDHNDQDNDIDEDNDRNDDDNFYNNDDDDNDDDVDYDGNSDDVDDVEK
jgi:hypothetical protein